MRWFKNKWATWQKLFQGWQSKQAEYRHKIQKKANDKQHAEQKKKMEEEAKAKKEEAKDEEMKEEAPSFR